MITRFHHHNHYYLCSCHRELCTGASVKLVTVNPSVSSKLFDTDPWSSPNASSSLETTLAVGVNIVNVVEVALSLV